ncbi:MAG: trehalase family glycosidase [Kiritimatiellae bacterium]|nr:trehalase family glycosidase [Kiritimatiellia bacterium]
MIQILLANLCAAALICSAASVSAAQERPGQPKLDGAPRLLVLDHGKLKAYVTQFNADDEELYANVPNSEALAFLEQNIPLFECPDEDFQRTYYFRWWSYRKHVKQTPDGYVITEFLPNVQWAGKHNTISCPAAHHYYEGRWLRNTTYLDDYSVFWLRKGGDPRSYSFWIADAFYARYKVTPNRALITDLLPDLVRNYEAWEKGFNWSGSLIGLRENGLFYTLDILDGGEVSIGGHGFRPTLNSFMYGDAKAIAAIARLDNKGELAKQYEAKAAELKRLVQQKLWDKEAQFFKVLPDESAQGNREPQHSGDTTLLRHTWWSQERLGGTNGCNTALTPRGEFPRSRFFGSTRSIRTAFLVARCRNPGSFKLMTAAASSQ